MSKELKNSALGRLIIYLFQKKYHQLPPPFSNDAGRQPWLRKWRNPAGRTWLEPGVSDVEDWWVFFLIIKFETVVTFFLFKKKAQ